MVIPLPSVLRLHHGKPQRHNAAFLMYPEIDYHACYTLVSDITTKKSSVHHYSCMLLLWDKPDTLTNLITCSSQ